ncbi:MAG: lytic transglycosylase domain-containing protein [Pseudonocardia sp.]
MPEPSPSMRFRGVALSVVAAGAALGPVMLLAGGNLGFAPIGGADGVAVESRIAGTLADLERLGASGVLPQTGRLSPELMAAIAAPGEFDPGLQAAIPLGPLSIPAVALDAYQRAEAVLVSEMPDCGLQWSLVAGLGKVISDHGGGLDPAGTTEGPIFGPRLDGRPGLAEIIDTDNGRLDGDTGYDRAVGPLQIIPLAWSGVGADSDGDGKASPHSIYDSALAAGRYLCDDEAELDDASAQAQALFRYQRSESFVRAALGWSRAYAIRQAQPQSDAVPAPLPVLPPPAAVLPLPPVPPPPGTTTPPPPTTPTPPPPTTPTDLSPRSPRQGLPTSTSET